MPESHITMNAILRHALTIQPQEQPRPASLIDLIPARARALGCISFEDYVALIDQEATAHLTGCNLARVSRVREFRRPRPFFDRQSGINCLSISLNRGLTMFSKVRAADWIDIQERGATGVWTATNIGGGRTHVYTELPLRKGAAASSITVARLILGLGPNERFRFIDGDTLNLRRENLFAVRLGLVGATLRGPRYDARQITREAAERRDQVVAEGRSFDALS